MAVSNNTFCRLGRVLLEGSATVHVNLVFASMVVNRSKQEDVCSRHIEGFLEKIWKRIFCKVRSYIQSSGIIF